MHLTLLRSEEPKLSGKSGQGIKLNDPWYPDKLESSMWKTACVNAAFELIHVDCRVQITFRHSIRLASSAGPALPRRWRS